MSFEKAVNLALTCFFLFFVAATSIIFFFISCLIRLLTFAFDKRRIANNLFSSFWASLYLWCIPNWSVKIIGREKLSIKESYIMVSNHQSQLDILVIYRLFYPLKWVSKAEVFKIPFIGWNMGLNGYVKLKRGDGVSISQMMNHCEQLLNNNNSILMFPEGTRSKTGQLRPFKPGAFFLAKKMKKDIVPLVINNSKDALPKHKMRLSGMHQIELTVLDKVAYDSFKDLSDKEIANMVQAIIAAHVKEEQLGSDS